MGYNLGKATDETTAEREANEREEHARNFAGHPCKPIPSDDEILKATQVLVDACHGRAWNAGWYHDPHTGLEVERNMGEIFALIHSEISEALEGHRKSLMDDKLPHRKMVPVELFDAVIRIFDTIGREFPDDVPALLEKMHFNDQRADHKPASRRLANGKKF